MPALPPGIWYHASGFVEVEAGHIELNDAPTPLRARTTALDDLTFEFRRYVDGQVRGRSCLIAGPRGSGKTTLINSAFDEVRSQQAGCELILVRLHGPSLLQKPPGKAKSPTDEKPASDPKSTTADAKAGGGALPAGAAERKAQKASEQQALSKHVLRIVLINLYQTLAEAIANAYQEYVFGRGTEALEMAAQLRLALDGAPSAETLRFFWEAAGALPRGVLKRQNPPSDQGMREIIALATAADAYRSCTGKFTRQTKNEESAGAKTEATGKLGGSGAELKQAFVSVTSGLGVGAVAAQYGGLNPMASVIAGAGMALLSTAAFSLSSTRRRETTVNEAVTFLPNLSVASLVHRAPLVLRRLRQAGVAPAFIVDELDKIDTLSDSLTDLASYLKFISADEAFFCFLTDRSYLAKIAATYVQRTDHVERTIFTNRLFINYHPRDFHQFLDEVIQPSGANSDSLDLQADAEAIRHVLIHRSRLLPFELVRAIAEIRQPNGRLNVRLNPRFDDRALRFHVMLELAVEVVLATQFVAERIDRDPEFGQTIYDALFYPTHLWYNGTREIDISGDAILKGIAAASGHMVSTSDADREFLRERVETMLDFVADPARLSAAVGLAVAAGRLSAKSQTDRTYQTVMTKVREAIPEQPRLLKRLATDRYEWIYNRYGIPFEAADVNAISDSPMVAAAITVLQGLEPTLRKVRLRPLPGQVIDTTATAITTLRRLAALQLRSS